MEFKREEPRLLTITDVVEIDPSDDCREQEYEQVEKYLEMGYTLKNVSVIHELNHEPSYVRIIFTLLDESRFGKIARLK